MTISSDNVKAVAFAVVGLFVGYVGWKVYSKISNGVASAASIPSQISQALAEVGKELDGATTDTATKMVNTIRASLGISPAPVDNGYIQPAMVMEITDVSRWPSSTKAAIRAIKKTRNIKVQGNNADFIGWKVYDNGTFIGPAGDYNMDVAAETPNLPNSADSFNFDPVWYKGASDYDFTKVLEQWQLPQESN